MAQKAIRIYTQEWTAEEYREAVANGDSPTPTDKEGRLYLITDHAEDFGHWNQDQTAWVPATDIATAFHLLTGSSTQFWASECSDTAAEISPGAWYSDEPYHHPYTGAVTEKSARLEGDWTIDDARAIRALVITR